MENAVPHFTLRSKEHDPDGSKLRALLDAHDMCEQMSATRSFFIHLLASASVLLWLGAGWPWLLSAQVQAFALTLWGSLFFIVLVSGLGEWIARHRRARYLAEYQVPQERDTG
jgi:hypothetical protein